MPEVAAERHLLTSRRPVPMGIRGGDGFGEGGNRLLALLESGSQLSDFILIGLQECLSLVESFEKVRFAEEGNQVVVRHHSPSEVFASLMSDRSEASMRSSAV